MNILRSILLRLLSYRDRLGSISRRSWYQIIYPNVDLGSSSVIGADLKLKCTDGGAITFGKKCTLEASTTVIARHGNIKVGERVFIGKGSYLVATESIIIGDDALIAEYVTIRDQDHAFKLGVNTNIAGMKASPIQIGDNVWVGAKATITRGVSIGKNSVIGANSVVTSDIPENSVAVGAPCKVIKTLAG